MTEKQRRLYCFLIDNNYKPDFYLKKLGLTKKQYKKLKGEKK